jgi:hypothetical protein
VAILIRPAIDFGEHRSGSVPLHEGARVGRQRHWMEVVWGMTGVPVAAWAPSMTNERFAGAEPRSSAAV